MMSNPSLVTTPTEQPPEFRRQHPVAAISKTLSYVRENLITVIVGVIIGTRNTDMTYTFFIAAGVGLILASGLASWWRFQFRVLNDEIQIISGLFVRKKLYLTKDRIQVIDISAGVVQRLFGLVRLDIQTAGSSSRAAVIDAVTLKEAEVIKTQLRSENNPNRNGDQSSQALSQDIRPSVPTGSDTERVEGYPPGSGADFASDSYSAPASEHQIYRLPGKDLLIAASTSGRFGIILSIMGAIYGQLHPVLFDAEWIDRLFSLLPAQTGLIYVISLAAIFILLAWLVSFFSTIINFSDFSVRVQPKELQITRGLFEKKRLTVPKDRIQSVYLQEGLLRQPFGLQSVHLNTAAYGDDKGGGTVQLFPLLARNKTERMLEALLPEYHLVLPALNPPVRAIRRYLLRTSTLPLLVAATLYIFALKSPALLLLPLFGALWGWLRYRDAAIGWDHTHLMIRERTLARTTALLEFRRIQDLTLSQTFFQRMRNLCTVRVHIASGDRGRSFSCKDLRADTGLELMGHFKKEKKRIKPV